MGKFLSNRMSFAERIDALPNLPAKRFPTFIQPVIEQTRVIVIYYRF
jgi:hypothetical protein